MTFLARTTPSAPGRLSRAVQSAATVERLALARTGVGVVMITRPRLIPGVLGVDSATSSRMGWSVQMLGAREVGLGLGSWLALRSGDARAARLWLAAGVVADAVDALAVGAAVVRGRLSAGTGSALVAVAATATALGVQAVSTPYDDVEGQI